MNTNISAGLFKPAGRSLNEDESTSEDDQEPEQQQSQQIDESEDVHDQEHIDEHEEDDHPGEIEEQQQPESEKEPTVQYDEETQALVDEATQARERYQEAERAVQDLLSEIHKLEERVERDYGPEEEFASLDSECFEYMDLEYIYTLCLFGKTTQRSKSGGSEVSLGMWNEWIGEGANKYTKAKYDRGLTCWNGPARSTIVSLKCGIENKLLSVSEPNRCEYAMEFMTPALCNPNAETTNVHDEL